MQKIFLEKNSQYLICPINCLRVNWFYEKITNGNLFKKRNLAEPFDNQTQQGFKEYWENKPVTPLTNNSLLERLRKQLCAL